MSDPTHQQVPLKQLNIYLSNGCSLSCRHCSLPAQPRNEQGQPQMPFMFLMQTVHEALPLGLEDVLLTGFEPLLHPQFDSIIEWLEPLPLNTIYVETSGRGMTAARAALLARSGRVSVSVGLDGVDACTHDELHQAPGLFAKAVQTVELLVQAGIQPKIVFTLTRRNAGQVAAMVRLAEELGAASVRFSILQPQCGEKRGSGDTDEDDLDVAELIALGWRVERDIANSTRLRLAFDQPPAFRGLHPSGYIEGQGRCSILSSLGVLPSGEYALCGAGLISNDLILGKIGVNWLEDVWRSHSVLQQLRRGMPERLEGICERCILKTACLGNCAAENYISSGSFWGPYWFCEAAERAGLFPAGRLIENNW